LNEVVSGFIYVVSAVILSAFKVLPPNEVLDAVLHLKGSEKERRWIYQFCVWDEVLDPAEFAKFLDEALVVVGLAHLHDAHNERLHDDLAVEGDLLVDLLLPDLRP
jgi:hypothetical protein